MVCAMVSGAFDTAAFNAGKFTLWNLIDREAPVTEHGKQAATGEHLAEILCLLEWD